MLQAALLAKKSPTSLRSDWAQKSRSRSNTRQGECGLWTSEGRGFLDETFSFKGLGRLGAMATAPAFAQHATGGSPGKKKVIHVNGCSHIDAPWLWPWRDGSDTVLTTFHSALDRINETPGFCYSHSSSAHYRWVERADPEMLSEIQRRVREGRWEVVGGWPVEPDCNIPSTESFVRHALYGKAYCQSALGADVNIGFNPDSFGHAAGLPTILKRAGYGYYVFMRPQEHEMDLPLLFWWEAADGSPWELKTLLVTSAKNRRSEVHEVSLLEV